jgi:hypothetical protein
MNRPDTVTVYCYRVFDPDSREMLVAEGKAPLALIRRMRLAEPVPGTGEDVLPQALDDRGRYRRVPTGWAALG